MQLKDELNIPRKDLTCLLVELATTAIRENLVQEEFKTIICRLITIVSTGHIDLLIHFVSPSTFYS